MHSGRYVNKVHALNVLPSDLFFRVLKGFPFRRGSNVQGKSMIHLFFLLDLEVDGYCCKIKKIIIKIGISHG